METLIFPALFVYFLYHVLTRSDLCAPARAWAKPFAPQWLVYIASCPLCFSFWAGVGYTIWTVVTTGFLIFFPILLLAVPVFNMVLDLVVKALIRANEPPVIGEGKTVTEGDRSISTWRGQNVVYCTAATPLQAGQMVSIVAPPSTADGVKIPESSRFAHLPVNEAAPDGWEQVNRDSSLYRTSGVFRWWPGKLVGRKVRIVEGPRTGQTGTIDNGDGPAVFRSGMDVTPWSYFVKPDVALVPGPDDPHDGRIKVLARDCVLLDEPFNPLAHEQTK